MSLTLVTGPMFAGKTTYLMNWIHKMSRVGKVLSVKHSSDDRYTLEERLVSHDGRTMSCIKASRLSSALREAQPEVLLVATRESEAQSEELLDFDYLAIDEGQFFPDLVEVCDELSRAGKHILVAALLCGDFRWITNGQEIIPYVDDSIMLKAKCSDCSSGKATISRRRNREEPFRVGGADTYVSLCRSCYYKWDDLDKKNGVTPVWEVART